MWQVAFGESHKIVGGHPSLGSWDVGAAPFMHWSDGNIWTLDIDVPAGQGLEFKVCLSFLCWLIYSPKLVHFVFLWSANTHSSGRTDG